MVGKKTGQMDQHDKPLRMCILGGGGYLGQCLTKELQSLGHFVVVMDLNFESLPYIAVDPLRMLQIKGSILHTDQLQNALKGCDACFHLAGYGTCGGASLDRPMSMLINYEGTKTVIEQCLQLGIPRLIYSSSVGVIFFDQEMDMADETTPYLTTFGNAYSESKCLAEQALLKANIPGKLATCALRLRGIYGPGELRSTQRVVDLCLKGLGNKFTFCKSSPCLTQYSSAHNCTIGFIAAEKALRKPNSPAGGQAYHILDGGAPVEPFKFWFPLMQGVGVDVPRIQLPYWLVYYTAVLMEWLYWLIGLQPLFTKFEVCLMGLQNTFSIDKAARDLDYRPVKSHDLRDTINFFRQQQVDRMKAKGQKRKGWLDFLDWNWRASEGKIKKWNLSCRLLKVVRSECQLDLALQGQFHRQVSSPVYEAKQADQFPDAEVFEKIVLSSSSSSVWGDCYAKLDGNAYVFGQPNKSPINIRPLHPEIASLSPSMCFRCITLIAHTSNVLQSMHQDEEICHESVEVAEKSCFLATQIPSPVDGSLLFRSEYYDSSSCHLDGMYSVAYTLLDLDSSSSFKCALQSGTQMSNCDQRNRMKFNFRNCSFPDFEQTLVCLGTWPVGRHVQLPNSNSPVEQYLAVLNLATQQYKCGVMQQWTNRTTKILLSADSSCSGLLKDGSNALEDFTLIKELAISAIF
uniref:3-beta hydroxysteroid dehydrogenase/isomerase domain-containing protein n=1 Tax=Ditylenchus dipsaci TaxID=166011 RepID=A0A915EIL6_9BILA